MTKDYEKITGCRLCKSPKIDTVLYFGYVALANSYPQKQDEEQKYFPLDTVLCSECGHVGLRDSVNPDLLFKNYIYSTGDSPNLVKYFEKYAKDVVLKFRLGEMDSILEFGANDFTLLKEFQKLGLYQLAGVEPATNIFEKIDKTGIWAFNDFFNRETADKIKEQKGKFNFIISNNTFAHIDCIDSVVEGVLELLTNDGVFIFENAYLLDTVKGLYFDQIYSEHVQYYGFMPLKKYLESYGLEIFDVILTSNQGGSFRCFTQRKGGKRKIEDSVQECINNELKVNLYKKETYDEFYSKLLVVKSQLQEFMSNNKDKTFCCYGCPAKFALFSKFFGLHSGNIKFVIDDAPAKQGRFSPGSNIPIVSFDKLYTENIDYCIVSVWNMADFIINKNKKFQENGKFVLVLPEFKVL